jgi:hypothetical protein
LANAQNNLQNTGQHVQDAYGKLHHHIGCSYRWICAVSLSHKYYAQEYSRTFQFTLVWDGWSWQMPQRACKARASKSRLPMASPVSCLVLMSMDMRRILHTHPHARTVHSTPNHSNSSWFGMVGAGKCLNELVNHGPVGAGCLWQAPSPYRVLKQVDMRRILVTHSHARTVHNTSNQSNSSWFGMVGAGKCSNERAKHGPVGAG